MVYDTAIMLQGRADRILRPFDLTLEQLHPLKLLTLHGGRVGQKDLCGLAGKTPANMTRIIDRLAKKGLVERVPDPDDRRAYIIVITEAGEELVDRVVQVFESYTEAIMAGIGGDEEEACRLVLRRLQENVNNLEIEE